MPINQYRKESPALNRYIFLKQTRFIVIACLLFMIFSAMRTANADYQIGADDTLQIKVYGYEDLTSEPKVSESGRITFPLLGTITVGGLTPVETENKIARLLKSGSFIHSPHVTVTVIDYQSQLVSVLGQVNKPGRYPLQSSGTLIELIAMAGGINDQGDERVIVSSATAGKRVNKEINLHDALNLSGTDFELTVTGGDVLYIPKAPVFYIHGEVHKPGVYRLGPNMSVSQAISAGGGLTPRGSLRGTVVERRNIDGHIETIDVELTDPVYTNDVVVVDERLF